MVAAAAFVSLLAGAQAQEKSIRVFVALCDNKTQGIMPVGAKIGDGDKPDANLYWGCTDGFGAYFQASKSWKVKEKAGDVSEVVLRRMVVEDAGGAARIVAEAYRGSAMRQCVEDFEKAVASGEHDLVAFIGHNGLMDFRLPEPAPKPRGKTDAIMLCCMSEPYFRERLETMGARPVLLTKQLMYPGSFLLHDALRAWLRKGTPAEIRSAAARAYAKNQKISTRAASGIFAELK